jgi:hypothetical protein
VRKRRLTFGFAVIGATCIVIAHIIWWIWVNPANAAMAQMRITAPAADWVEWRNQWEYTHFARFVLQFLSLAMLLLSVLLETPEQE